MKEKIEEILRTHSVVSNIQGVRFIGLCTHVGAYKDVKKPYDREVGALIKELSTLIQAERKEAVRGLIEYLESHTDEIFYLGCGKMINEYLGTVESEGIEREKK